MNLVKRTVQMQTESLQNLPQIFMPPQFLENVLNICAELKIQSCLQKELCVNYGNAP